MEYKVHCPSSDTALHRALTRLVDEHLPQIDRLTAKFPVRSLMLSVEKHKGNHLIEIKLSLVLENQAVSTSASSPHLESAVSLAFRKLYRQIRIVKEGLRRTRTYERVRALKHAVPPPEEIAALAAELEAKVAAQDFLGFRDRLTDLLPRLEKFVRREIRYCDGGEELPGRAEFARDVVEEALLHTYEKFREKPEGLDPEKWIFRHALELVGVRVHDAREEMLENEWSRQQIESSRGNGRQGEDLEEDLLDDLENFPLEIVDFDTISAPADNAEEAPAPNDRRQFLEGALEGLPVEERKALFLCFLEGFRPAEAAAVLNCSEGWVRRLLEDGARRLRGQLR